MAHGKIFFSLHFSTLKRITILYHFIVEKTARHFLTLREHATPLQVQMRSSNNIVVILLILYCGNSIVLVL